MPVGELLARTSALELSEWMAYEREYGPLGLERGDWQAAQVAHAVVAVAAGKKGRRFKLTDFLLKWGGGRKRPQAPEEQLEIFRALALRQEKQETNGEHR